VAVSLTRRGLLRALVGVGMASGGALLAACQQPLTGSPTAAATGRRVANRPILQILLWQHFADGFDRWLDNVAADWGAANGVLVSMDHLPQNALPARLAAELAAQSGHDLIAFAGQVRTHLYGPKLLDLSDLADSIGKKYGGWLPLAPSLAKVGDAWRGIPDFYVVTVPQWRSDLFQQMGAGPPGTWDDLLKVGRYWKSRGHPSGIQISHCNDANDQWRTILWGFGAHEVDGDGKTLTVDTPQMRAALQFAKALFDEAMTPDVFGWDDSSNNLQLGSGIASWIHDQLGPFWNTYLFNKDVFNTLRVSAEVAGPVQRLGCVEPNVWGIWSFARNPPAARDFVLHYNDLWRDAMIASKGMNMPFLNDHFQKPMPILGEDPVLQVVQDYRDIAYTYGYPGPPTAAAEEAYATFVIPDMIALYVRGGSLQETLAWAGRELKRIYVEHGSVQS
jgi:multiple sugar transport system substrate-binding protein